MVFNKKGVPSSTSIKWWSVTLLTTAGNYKIFSVEGLKWGATYNNALITLLKS